MYTVLPIHCFLSCSKSAFEVLLLSILHPLLTLLSKLDPITCVTFKFKTRNNTCVNHFLVFLICILFCSQWPCFIDLIKIFCLFVTLVPRAQLRPPRLYFYRTMRHWGLFKLLSLYNLLHSNRKVNTVLIRDDSLLKI